MKKIHIYGLPLTSVLAIMLLFIVLWTAISIVSTKRLALCSAWRVINIILSGIAVIVILRYTILARASLESEAVPFIRTLEQIKVQPELIREMVMNAFLFFPFGLVLPYAIGTKMGKPKWRIAHGLVTVVIAFLLSCTIELLQYVCNLGNAELSDIVMNTLGAGAGTISYVIFRLIHQKINNET